ncbi:MAG: hypothetical protein ACYC0J_08230, partial [Gammaproteobacteria bacterium]
IVSSEAGLKWISAFAGMTALCTGMTAFISKRPLNVVKPRNNKQQPPGTKLAYKEGCKMELHLK